MAFTYDPSISSNTDKVRLIIGDTNTNDPILQDEEIAYFLGEVDDNPNAAAVMGARAAAAKYARLADTSVESVRVSYSQKSDGFWKLADQLQSRLDITTSDNSTGLPSATGVSISASRAANCDTDRRQDQFYQGMFKN